MKRLATCHDSGVVLRGTAGRVGEANISFRGTPARQGNAGSLLAQYKGNIGRGVTPRWFFWGRSVAEDGLGDFVGVAEGPLAARIVGAALLDGFGSDSCSPLGRRKLQAQHVQPVARLSRWRPPAGTGAG